MAGGKLCKEGSPRRGDVFPRLLDLPDGDAPEEGQRGRRREGECPVGAVDMTGSLLELSAGDGADPEVFESGACRDDVGDGILSPDFMEADILGRDPVDASFRFGDPAEDRECPLLDGGGEVAADEQVADFGVIQAMGMVIVIPVVMMMVIVAMPALPVVVSVGMSVSMSVGVMARDPEPPSCDSATEGPFKAAFGQGDRERGQGPEKDLLGNPEVVEGGDGHVAADPGKGVNVEVRHGCS